MEAIAKNYYRIYDDKEEENFFKSKLDHQGIKELLKEFEISHQEYYNNDFFSFVKERDSDAAIIKVKAYIIKPIRGCYKKLTASPLFIRESLIPFYIFLNPVLKGVNFPSIYTHHIPVQNGVYVWILPVQARGKVLLGKGYRSFVINLDKA